MGRTQYPRWYAFAKRQPVYVEAVQNLWLRTHYFYEQVGDMYPQLGISDDVYRAQAVAPENLAELEMFTGRTFDGSSCFTE